MVSGQTIGIVGVGIGTVLIIFDFNQAGFGLMILGIVGAIGVEAATAGGESGRRR